MLTDSSTFTGFDSSDTIRGMGRAGQALKQTLELCNISQNKLAVVLGVDRAVVNRWFHEQVDPNGESIVEIVRALKRINHDAAETFINRYLGDILTEPDAEDEA